MLEMETTIMYSFMYRVLTANKQYEPYLTLKTGAKEEMVKGEDMGNGYYISRIKVPVTLLKAELQFGVRVKSVKYGTNYLYKNRFYDLEICHIDAMVTIDIDQKPVYTPMLQPWIMSTGLVMHTRDMDAFTFQIARGPRFEFGVNQSLAMISNPFLSRMLRWGTSKGRYIDAYPHKISEKFIQYANHYIEILLDSKEKCREEEEEAKLAETCVEEVKKQHRKRHVRIINRIRKFFTRST